MGGAALPYTLEIQEEMEPLGSKPLQSRRLFFLPVRVTPPRSPLASLCSRGTSPVHNTHDSRGSGRAWELLEHPPLHCCV